MLIRRADLEGGVRDVRIAGGRIEAIAEHLAPRAGEGAIDAEGGALFPGLHDHHIHLLALAAALAFGVTRGDLLVRALPLIVS